MRTLAEREQEADKNRRALEASTALALLLLLRTKKQATKGFTPGRDDARRVAAALQAGIAQRVVEARAAARQSGVRRLLAEARSIGVDLKAPASALRVEALKDSLRAEVVAKQYARRWHSATQAGKGEPGLYTLARTESSEAFSSGRSRFADTRVDQRLLKIWDATMDKRTCPICRDADGTIVLMTERFPAGEPGAVHPNCACSWSLITETESRGLISLA